MISRLFQYIGGYKNEYIAPTLCFMLLDGAAIFRETTECSHDIIYYDINNWFRSIDIIVYYKAIAILNYPVL